MFVLTKIEAVCKGSFFYRKINFQFQGFFKNFIENQFNCSASPDGCEYPFLGSPFFGEPKKDTANQLENG